MARRESARSVREGCFLEWRSPFGRVTAKHRRSADPAAPATFAIQLAARLLQVKFWAIRRALLPVSSQAMPWALLRANSRTKVKLFVHQLAKPPLLEPQD